MGVALQQYMSPSSRPVCVIAGHSHTWALGFPKTHPDGDYGIIPHPCDWRFGGLRGPGGADPRYWAELVELSKAHVIALSFRGNQHLVDFMFAPTPAFDFAVASRPDLPVDDTVVLAPEMAVRELFAPSMTELGELLKRICAVRGPGVLLVEGPPPRDNLEEQRWQLLDHAYFVQAAAALGSDISAIPLAPALLHLKMWQVIRTMVRTVAAAHGVAVLPPPADAMTSTGFLREDLGAHDLSHANRAYGALVLRDLAAMLESEQMRQA